MSTIDSVALGRSLQDALEYLRDQARQKGLNVQFQSDDIWLRNGWYHIPTVVEGVTSAYSIAETLVGLEESWNGKLPKPSVSVLLEPAAAASTDDPRRNAVNEFKSAFEALRVATERFIQNATPENSAAHELAKQRFDAAQEAMTRYIPNK